MRKDYQERDVFRMGLWAEEHSAQLSPKERMSIERTKMPEQDAQQRAQNFREVNQGLAAEAAMREAQRCIQCRNRPGA